MLVQYRRVFFIKLTVNLPFKLRFKIYIDLHGLHLKWSAYLVLFQLECQVSIGKAFPCDKSLLCVSTRSHLCIWCWSSHRDHCSVLTSASAPLQ